MSTIVKGSNYMQAVLYTGTGATQTISGLDFQPDFVWIKSRSAATDHKLTDAVRGVTKALVSNSTAAETTDTTGITAFTSTGFTLGASSTYNNSGATYVAWCWKAGGAAVTNTAGTITSQVSANPSAGFSVVTYTGTGANATVGHGLGVAPKLIIVKARNQAFNWSVYSALLGNQQFVRLNTADSVQASALIWNATTPTSSVFSLGAAAGVNGPGDTHVAYCWSEIDGFSKFGSYIGNGSADGPFVYTGFKPKFVLIKSSTSAFNWMLIDGARNTYNLSGSRLIPNLSDAEANDNGLDILSNGFKLRSIDGSTNVSGGTMVYAAYAENPFKNSLAR